MPQEQQHIMLARGEDMDQDSLGLLLESLQQQVDSGSGMMPSASRQKQEDIPVPMASSTTQDAEEHACSQPSFGHMPMLVQGFMQGGGGGAGASGGAGGGESVCASSGSVKKEGLDCFGGTDTPLTPHAWDICSIFPPTPSQLQQGGQNPFSPSKLSTPSAGVNTPLLMNPFTRAESHSSANLLPFSRASSSNQALSRTGSIVSSNPSLEV